MYAYACANIMVEQLHLPIHFTLETKQTQMPVTVTDPG